MIEKNDEKSIIVPVVVNHCSGRESHDDQMFEENQVEPDAGERNTTRRKNPHMGIVRKEPSRNFKRSG